MKHDDSNACIYSPEHHACLVQRPGGEWEVTSSSSQRRGDEGWAADRTAGSKVAN